VPTQDFFAVCNLAASLCCRALAAQYAKVGNSTIAADSVAHATKSGEFSRRAKEFEDLYKAHMGIGVDRQVQGAGDFVDWNTAPAGGRDYIFHRNR
jgi:hypothetical protein